MSEALSDPLNFDYEWFIKKIFYITQLDLNCYKRAQMERRIQHLMGRNQAVTYVSYLKLLESSPAKLHDFINWVTINVSEFYRDNDRWQILEQQVMPELLKRFTRLRIWSAGCSNGSEPYSLAILLNELGSAGHYIVATDIDDTMLANASQARYKASEIKSIPDKIKEKYFKIVDDDNGSNFLLEPEIKKRVVFKRHNLFVDPFEEGMNLIVCRNVVIYFTNEAKDQLYGKFASSLVKDGIFFVGSTESLLNSKKYDLTRTHTAFYQKV